MKLDIGSGGFRYRDYTTVDLYCEADLKCDMGELPISDGSVEDIWASHCLEHVRPSRVQPTLKEWLRVLKPKGTATIVVPDLDYACRMWLELKNSAAQAMIFGNEEQGQQHFLGWGSKELIHELASAGFDVFSINSVHESATDNLGGTFWHNMVSLVAQVRKP